MSDLSIGDLAPRIPDLKVPNPAKDAFENLREVVKSYAAQAEEGFQAIITLANHPDFQVLSVSYSGSHLMVFTGARPDGTLARIFQHVTQINVMVSFCPIANQTPPRREIGFFAEFDPKSMA